MVLQIYHFAYRFPYRLIGRGVFTNCMSLSVNGLYISRTVDKWTEIGKRAILKFTKNVKSMQKHQRLKKIQNITETDIWFISAALFSDTFSPPPPFWIKLILYEQYDISAALSPLFCTSHLNCVQNKQC